VANTRGGAAVKSKILVIYNTKSGVTSQLDQLQAAFAGQSVDVVYKKIHPRLANDIKAAAKAGRTIIVAAGGDGTVSAVASCIQDTDLTLGIIPTGTLNHFAKDLHIPLAIDEAVAIIVKGMIKKVDVGSVNDRVFINNSSIGIYPTIVREREKHQHRIGKWPAALWALIKVMMHVKRYRVEVHADNKVYKHRTPFIFVGNNSYRLVQAGFNNRVELTKGILSVHWITTAKIPRIVCVFLRALLGSVHRERDFQSLTTTEMQIHAQYPQMNVAFDGEVALLKTPLRYKIHPASLAVLVNPKG